MNSSPFFNCMVILWILCLVTLGVVAKMGYSEIAEQKKIDNMEKRTESTGR